MIVYELYTISYTMNDPILSPLKLFPLFFIADILRAIFSLTIAAKNGTVYRSIRLTCKRFKTVLDTLSVRPLLFSSKRYRECPVHMIANPFLLRTLADDLKLSRLLHAPRRVQRAFFLVEPEKRLAQLQIKLFQYATFHPDYDNVFFCYYSSHRMSDDDDEANDERHWGSRIEYHCNREYTQVAELLQFYLGFDEEMRLVYKAAIIDFILKASENGYPISRELFALIGSLLPFTEEELALKVDHIRYALFGPQPYGELEDKDDMEDEILDNISSVRD